MAPQAQPFTAKGFLKTFTILHLALFAGPIIFLVATYAQPEKTAYTFKIGESVFTYIIPFLTGASIFVGNMLGRKKLEEAKNKATLQEKLVIYQSSSIIRYALLEGTALLAIVTFGNEYNFFYLIFAAIAIGYVLYLRPTKDKITTDLNLTAKEVRQFDQ